MNFDCPIELPLRLELLLLAVIPGSAAFAIWRIYDALAERGDVLSRVLGFSVDLRPALVGVWEPVCWLSLIGGLFPYLAARRWIQRTIAQVI